MYIRLVYLGINARYVSLELGDSTQGHLRRSNNTRSVGASKNVSIREV